ncbi:PP2C family serine/threonine-protein phosphatase [Herpetosiphon giganteus]|uniref:PP2C family serine/threonine-protein phosphatase n=1 Tax=Herpetosiphon giganteus TaxID=2029754 RepID=UPI0019573251|nr:PP2C family serine/threonine-protein phosphatase [Herpetosiphon giganteus]MBM7846534.1 hypothetical protein [Herpetosiphon giganteus]
MTESQSSPTGQWGVIGHSVRGAAHIRQGLPNQDSLWRVASQSYAVMSLADGHGSTNYCRSDHGARLAAEIGGLLLARFLDSLGHVNIPQIEYEARHYLPATIIKFWLHGVFNHLNANPWNTSEMQRVIDKAGARAWLDIVANPAIAYGSTLLAVGATDRFFICLQLGDGDILCVDANGRPQRLFPDDERFIANETTSLCMSSAAQEFRVRLMPIDGQPPPLILGMTDGYANSYSDEEDFLKVAPDYLQMLRAGGVEYVASDLPRILNTVSELGSGDDVTIAMLIYSPVTRSLEELHGSEPTSSVVAIPMEAMATVEAHSLRLLAIEHSITQDLSLHGLLKTHIRELATELGVDSQDKFAEISQQFIALEASVRTMQSDLRGDLESAIQSLVINQAGLELKIFEFETRVASQMRLELAENHALFDARLASLEAALADLTESTHLYQRRVDQTLIEQQQTFADELDEQRRQYLQLRNLFDTLRKIVMWLGSRQGLQAGPRIE